MIWSTFDLEVITPKTINLYPSLTIIVGLDDFEGKVLSSKMFETIKCCRKSLIAILTICKRNLFVKIQSTYQIQEKWNRKNINYVAGKIRNHRTLFWEFTRLSARTISPSVHVNFPATYLAANLFDWSAIKPNAFQKDIKTPIRSDLPLSNGKLGRNHELLYVLEARWTVVFIFQMFYAIVAGKIWSMITFVTKDNFNYSFAIVVSLFLIPLGWCSMRGGTRESATLNFKFSRDEGKS